MLDKFFAYDVASEGTISLMEQVWREKYRFEDEETPQASFARVVNGVYFEDDSVYAMAALDSMNQGLWCPAGRIQAGAGTPKRVTWINCISGDTLVHTDSGAVPAYTLQDKTVNVLTHDGLYRSAAWKSFGEQEVYEVKFSNGDIEYATADHRWLARQPRRELKTYTTLELVGKRVPFVAPVKFEYDVDDFNTGVRHGIIFGDGSLKRQTSSYVRLYGEKKSLASYFGAYPQRDYGAYLQVNKLPTKFKSVPKVHNISASYARGFIAGLIATDGHVDNLGHAFISQKHNIVSIRTVATYGSLPTCSITCTRTHSPFTGEHSPLYKLSFVKHGVNDGRMIIRHDHKFNMVSSSQVSKRASIEVVSVEKAGKQEVFCCSEPVTQTMVIGNGIVTRQCYVMQTIPDSLDGIMDILKDAALTQQQGGGVGMDFSSLRPRGAVVVRTGSVSSGVIPFMRMWHSMCSTIRSSGSRRGAMMGVLRVDHPDILEFIDIKHTAGELTNFNISVAVTDEFMLAVEHDHMWNLGFSVRPAESEQVSLASEDSVECIDGWYVYRTLPARELWDKILQSTFEYAEPGVIFIDRINKENNLFYCETIAATNPCVAPGTMITTPKGLRKVQDIRPGNYITTGALSSRPVSHIEIEEKVPVFRVKLSDGGFIDVTTGHQFLARKSDNQPFEPHRLSELRLGDVVKTTPVIPRKDYEKGEGTFKNLGIDSWRRFGYCIGRTWTRGREVHSRNYGWVNPKILDAIYDTYLKAFKFGFYPRIVNNNQPMNKGFVDAVFTYCGVLDDSVPTHPALAVKVPNDIVMNTLRLTLMHLGIFPKRDRDELIVYGKDLQIIAGLLSNQPLRNKLERLIVRLDLEAPAQYARIINITPVGSSNLVFDLFEEHTDTYVANGYVSKGCGEQPLPPGGACNLGAVNLARLVRDPFLETADMDWDALEDTVKVGVRFLDNVLDQTPYPLESQRVEAMNKRRIGLGVTGLGNMLQFMQLRYGSPEAHEFIRRVMYCIQRVAYTESAWLAKERGAFPLYSEEILRSSIIEQLPMAVRDIIREYGLRNGVILTIAPTGTTSIYYGNVSSGLEPSFAWEFDRKVRREGKDDEWDTFKVRDYGFEVYCKTFGVPPFREDNRTYDLPQYMVTALELSVGAHLEVQSICQEYVDASISKTINCPEDMTFDDFSQVYMDAYTSGCKGCTTYKPSKTRGWVLSTGDLVDPSNDSGNSPFTTQNITITGDGDNLPVRSNEVVPRIPRPETVSGVTYKLVYPGKPHAFYITINDVKLSDDRIVPFEMFINTKDVFLHEWLHALTRLASAVFQRAYGDVAFLVEELQQVHSVKTGAWYEGKFCPSFVAAIGQILGRHLERAGYYDTEILEPEVPVSIPEIMEMCEACGSFGVIMQSGCETCTSCGYSKCS